MRSSHRPITTRCHPMRRFSTRLRTRSTEVFSDQSQPSDETGSASTEKSKMMFLAPRTWAAVAAALVLIVSWFWTRPGEEADKTLGVVLAQLTDAQSLHLKLVRLGQPSDVWVARPNRLRWNRPDGTYQIDDGKQLWDINEQENQAVPQASQYFGAAQAGLDLLQLLDVTKPQDQSCRAGPAARGSGDRRRRVVRRLSVDRAIRRRTRCRWRQWLPRRRSDAALAAHHSSCAKVARSR